jgi:hypothetical protein
MDVLKWMLGQRKATSEIADRVRLKSEQASRCQTLTRLKSLFG